ncbi:MAG: hypothetical protein PHV30_11435, partial [Candidatus Margulisbacteria bacterium]|nr:hypothetical protein [Candidatus Margulisiibacteriota bacterium]
MLKKLIAITLTKPELEIIKQDFKGLLEKYQQLRFEEQENRRTKKDPLAHMCRSISLKSVEHEEPGLVWYNGVEKDIARLPRYLAHKKIGNPADYLPIRENFDKLKSFLANTLDRGEILAIADRDGANGTMSSEYPAWLYTHCENPVFKQNFEKAVWELLQEAFDKEYTQAPPEDKTKRTCGGYKWPNPEFSTQFNRLIGLLQIIFKLNNGFPYKNEIRTLLEQKAREGFFKDAPDLIYEANDANIYNTLLAAVINTQTENSFQDFWLDMIAEDPKEKQAALAIMGLVTAYKNKNDRRQLLPVILEKLVKRNFDLDKTVSSVRAGFIFENNFLDSTLNFLRKNCFDNSVFHIVDKKAEAVDFITDIKEKNGLYSFKIARATATEIKYQELSYNIIENVYSGYTEAQETINAYFNVMGYPAINNIYITSLEGRLTAVRNMVIDSTSTQLTGLYYEGIIGLNNCHFPFIFDIEDESVFMASPVKTTSTIGARPLTFEDRKFGLDNLKNKVPLSEFYDIPDFGKLINELIQKERDEAIGIPMARSLFTLENKISPDIVPYLIRAIKRFLVK